MWTGFIVSHKDGLLGGSVLRYGQVTLSISINAPRVSHFKEHVCLTASYATQRLTASTMNASYFLSLPINNANSSSRNDKSFLTKAAGILLVKSFLICT